MIRLADDPERGADIFCALIENLRLLRHEVAREVPQAEAEVDRAVTGAVRTLLAAWEGRL